MTKTPPQLPPPPKLTRLQLAESNLEGLAYRYEESNNPVFVWMAWDIVTKYNMEIPKWVLAYFDHSATSLLALMHPDAQKDANAVTKAFGFNAGKGERSSFTEAELTFKEEILTMAVGKRISGGEYETYAFEYLAKDFTEGLGDNAKEKVAVSASTVRRAYKKSVEDLQKEIDSSKQGIKNSE